MEPAAAASASATVPAATPAPVAVATAAATEAVAPPPAKAAAPKIKKDRIAEPPKSAARSSSAAPLVDLHGKGESAAAPVPPEPINARASASAVTAGLPLVTITGCLEISTDADEFRLTDTEGLDAPKARSWRSGFLKKRSAAVVLVDPPDSQSLKTQVGRRVTATGVLTSHELKVSSLRVLGTACD